MAAFSGRKHFFYVALLVIFYLIIRIPLPQIRVSFTYIQEEANRASVR